MTCRVYRNLDRPFTLFGVKGRYIPVALVGLLGIVIVSIVAGRTATGKRASPAFWPESGFRSSS